MNLDQPHPEGGFFGETVRSAVMLEPELFPDAPKIKRNLYSHIYYLLRKQDISAVHRLNFPERWHYYTGDPMLLYILENDKEIKEIRLTDKGDNPMIHFEVPSNTWMWAKAEDGAAGFSMIGCSMTPAFHAADWEMATKRAMMERYPKWEKTWEKFCAK